LYNKAYSYFGIGDYKKALSFINEVLNDNEQNLRQDIYSFSRLLNLVLHYELENYDFLEYVIKSTNRYLSKYERDYKIEDVLIKYIRKLSKVSSPKASQEIFVAMNKEVNILMQDHQERVVLEFFNIEAWIDSKINKTSFSESVQKCLKSKVVADN
jgi:tetratricopeptide (TPR) repeat protein